jgi:hypothetical protein
LQVGEVLTVWQELSDLKADTKAESNGKNANILLDNILLHFCSFTSLKVSVQVNPRSTSSIHLSFSFEDIFVGYYGHVFALRHDASERTLTRLWTTNLASSSGNCLVNVFYNQTLNRVFATRYRRK